MNKTTLENEILELIEELAAHPAVTRDDFEAFMRKTGMVYKLIDRHGGVFDPLHKKVGTIHHRFICKYPEQAW